MMQKGDIVVVEDKPENLRLLAAVLSEKGYKIRPAPTGGHALRTIERNPPDLILLDIMLPDLDGYEVCRQLKQSGKTSDIPIIFLSALDAVEDKMKGFSVGGIDYITKPFHTEEVIARVATHLKLSSLEKELRDQANRFKILAEATFEGIILHKDGLILDVNREATRLFGYSDTDLIGQNLREMIPPEFQQAIQTEQIYPSEGEIIQRDKTILHVEIRTKNLITQDKQIQVTAIRDLTREKKIEQEKLRLLQENNALKISIQDRYRYRELIGRSPAMQTVYKLISKAAATDYNIVISGESGTGKELTAKTIHALSSRQNEPFITVNCGAVTESLFEREFFGHCKGAFTDAVRDGAGFFDAANQGTLFLDEISEMQPAMQVKLLRVLENGEYIPVGGTQAKKADVRIIAATNRDLLALVRQGNFREDLYYRIHVIEIPLPPLRERREDIRLLVEHFLAQDGASDRMAGLPDKLREMLFHYDWPGNVRELKNAVQRYLATDYLFLPDQNGKLRAENTGTGDGLHTALESLEKKMIMQALKKTQWHRGNTARLLKIPRRTLQRKIQRYRLQPQQ